MTIIVDTREQKPVKFTQHKVLRKALHVGDYTTTKLVRKYHIERKSPIDLYATLTKGNRRFKREIWRSWESNTEMEVFVECTRKQFVTKNFKRGDMLQFPEHGLHRLIETFEERYDVVFVWCGSRKRLERMILKKLQQMEATF